MKSNKEYLIEDELTMVQQLLEKIDLEKMIDKELVDEIEDIPVEEEVSDIGLEISPGYVKAIMDPMKMKLILEVKAPINSDKLITMDDIKDRIKEYGPFAESQVDWKLVRDIYERVFHKDEIVGETIIARGREVEYEIPEHIIIKNTLYKDLKPKLLEDNRVDFHSIKSFICVQKGEYIGDIIPKVSGISGMTLLGKEIKPPKKYINDLRAGDNVFIAKSKLYSAIDGSFKIIDGLIVVSETLQINSDIDYSTGDIDFKGDLEVVKSVREGFSVKSRGDILIRESIEPSNIECGNNLNVLEGIIGSDKYSVFSKGNIQCKHIENGIVRGYKSIYIENSTVQSSIYCKDSLILGKSGAINGGNLKIQNEIVTYTLGNSSGVKTSISLGIDYEVEDKLKSIQNSSIDIVEHMSILQKQLSMAETREDRDKIKDLFLSLKNKLNSLNNYSRSLLSKLDRNEGATLKVFGTVYPGTYIEICHISYVVTKKLSNVLFSLNKRNGEIEWSPL